MNLLAKIGLFGLLAGTASALYADPAGGWLSPNGVAGAGGGASTAASGVAQVGQVGQVGPGGTTGTGTPATTGAGATVTISLVEMQPRVRSLQEQMRADARHIQHLQQIARKEKDVIKLNCVNDKLVQVKPQMNIADNAELELESATEATRMSVFETLTGAVEAIRRLREEADQCIGERIQGGGESSNSFTGPDAPDDPTKGFTGNELEPPGYASPFD